MAHGLPRSLNRAPAVASTIKKVIIPLRDVTIAVAAAGAGIGFGSVVLGGLPEAHLKILAVATNITLEGSGADANLVDTWEGDFGIGSTPADDATITNADVDLISSTAVGPAVAEVAPTLVVADGVDLVLDNTDGSLEINLNVLIDAADITDAESVDLTVNGVVEITLITMLDD